jgi:SAM-dependent methyltransferase
MQERNLYTSCPLCESKNIFATVMGECSAHVLYNKSLSPLIQWFECSDCSHVFTEGYYTDDACEVLFRKTNDEQKVGADIEKIRPLSSRMIEKVLPYQSMGIWLDVGFGNGSLLFTAEEYGFKAIGLDLRANNVKVMQSLGIESYCEDITNLRLENKCSVISMADVLEHMPYPKKGLIASNKLLNKKGILLLSMPNTENILWRAMTEQNQNPYWGEMEHYHNFSRTRLYALLRELGFEPLRYGISERYRVCMEILAIKMNDI